MDSRRAASVFVLLLAACTACAGLEDGDKIIPYDSKEACLRVVGADWQNSTCRCSNFHLPTPNRTSCVPRLANAAKACQLSEQCADVMQFGECSSGVCACPDKFHYQLGRCWLSAGLGDACTRDEDCHVNYDPLSATCSPDRKCECSYGYYTRGNIDCRREADAVGDECGIDNDCKFAGGACNADNRTCYVSKEMQVSEDKQYLGANSSTASTTSTVTSSSPQSSVSGAQTSAPTTGSPAGSALIGAECTSDASCSGVEDSRCFGQPGRCECLPGFFGDDGTSACVREIGETCDSTKNCSGIDYAECRNNTCVCLVGYIAISNNRACKQAKAYGNSCSPKFPEQCSNYGSRCECLDKPSGEVGQQCLCASGYHFVPEENLCWVSRGLGDPCQADLDCVVDVGSAVCANDTCRCSPELYLSHDGSQCVNVTALGNACSTSEDCSRLGQNIECSANKCRCLAHYYEGSGGDRVCLPGLGAPCVSNASCSRENSECLDNLCACGDGYVASSDGETCLEVAKKMGSKCSEKQQCTQSFGDLSLCKENRCACGDDNQFRVGECREKKAPGDKCKNSAECYVTNDVSLVECRNGLCQCKFGYTLSSNGECSSNGAVHRTTVSASTLLWALLAAASHLTVLRHPLYTS